MQDHSLDFFPRFAEHADSMKLRAILLFFIFQFSLLTAAGPSVSDEEKYSAYPAISSENGQTAAFALSQDATRLLGNKDGTLWLFSWNADCASGTGSQSASISGSFDYLNADQPLLTGNLSAFSLSSNSGSDKAAFSFNINAASAESLSVRLDKAHFYQNDISFCSGKIALTVNSPITMQPFVVYSDLASKNGSFYAFNGYSAGTPIKAAGLEACYNNHTASLLYGTSHISVFEPLNTFLLATADASFLKADWSLAYKTDNWNFSSSLGYIGIYPDISLSLTKDNQKYIGFPLQYMNITINGRMDILSFAQRNALKLGSGTLSLDVTGAFCFYSDFISYMQWQYKSASTALYRALFEGLSITPGSSGYTKTDYRNLQFTAFMLPEITYDRTIKTSSLDVHLSASKQFPLVFKIGNCGSTVLESWSSDGKPFKFIKDFDFSLTASDIFGSAADYLFSGLTLSITVNY